MLYTSFLVCWAVFRKCDEVILSVKIACVNALLVLLYILVHYMPLDVMKFIIFHN